MCYSRVTEAKRHLLSVTPYIVAGAAFYENLHLTFTINSLQQPRSEALDFYDGWVRRERHAVLQRSTTKFVTIDIEQHELAAKQFRRNSQLMVLHANGFKAENTRNDT